MRVGDRDRRGGLPGSLGGGGESADRVLPGGGAPANSRRRRDHTRSLRALTAVARDHECDREFDQPTAADNAGNSTTTPVGYSVTHAFAGFQAPQPKSPQKKGSSIPVKFILANYTYTGSIQYPNVTGLRAIISGPATASCSYSATIAAYQCQLKLPNTVGTYVLTVQEQLGTDWVALANTASATGTANANGETIALK
jgi:hypothetical protein